MTPQHCIVKHDPPHSYGDCLRACIASILNRDINSVPHFYRDGNDERGKIELHSWLNENGYRLFYTALGASSSLDDIFLMMSDVNKDIEYLLFCQCTDIDHVVVCQNNKIVHDPAWYRSPISGPTTMGLWVIAVIVPVQYA